MQLTITRKSREETVEVDDEATVADLKKAIQKKMKIHPHRQGLKQENIRLDSDEKKLSSYNLDVGAVITLKDLGPQIGYRTVFIVEYLGPILFFVLYGTRPAFIYGEELSKDESWSDVQRVAYWCFIAHFLKREFETIFVHTFSRPTMPLGNLFKNSIYYWSFAAVIGYPLCSPLYTAPSGIDQPFPFQVGLAIFLLMELGNFYTHVKLRLMRSNQKVISVTERAIPTGFLFDWVACPNYFCEVMSWVGFSLMTSVLFSWLFTLVGFLQMWEWAVKKHKGYIKSHGDKYKKMRRKAIIPFVL